MYYIMCTHNIYLTAKGTHKYQQDPMYRMTRWKKDATEFPVRVSSNGHTKSCRIPKPVLESLGVPARIKFVMADGRVLVEAGEE